MPAQPNGGAAFFTVHRRCGTAKALPKRSRVCSAHCLPLTLRSVAQATRLEGRGRERAAILRDAGGVYHRAALCADLLAGPQDEAL